MKGRVICSLGRRSDWSIAVSPGEKPAVHRPLLGTHDSVTRRSSATLASIQSPLQFRFCLIHSFSDANKNILKFLGPSWLVMLAFGESLSREGGDPRESRIFREEWQNSFAISYSLSPLPSSLESVVICNFGPSGCNTHALHLEEKEAAGGEFRNEFNASIF